MLTTTITGINATVTRGRDPSSSNNQVCCSGTTIIVDNKRLHWTIAPSLGTTPRLGRPGQLFI